MNNLKIAICGFLVLIIIFIFVHQGTSTAYSGDYIYSLNANISITLKQDNTFELNEALGKYDSIETGKYTIKDNEIKMEFLVDDGTSHPPVVKKGQFYGNKLILQSFAGSFMKMP